MRAVSAIVFLTLASQAKSDGLFSWLFGSGKEIKAEITLINKCELESRYFIVRDLKTGKSASFKNGVAKLNTKINSSLQLQLSPSVKHVIFEGNAVSAKKKMKLIADCSERILGGIADNLLLSQKI